MQTVPARLIALVLVSGLLGNCSLPVENLSRRKVGVPDAPVIFQEQTLIAPVKIAFHLGLDGLAARLAHLAADHRKDVKDLSEAFEFREAEEALPSVKTTKTPTDDFSAFLKAQPILPHRYETIVHEILPKLAEVAGNETAYAGVLALLQEVISSSAQHDMGTDGFELTYAFRAVFEDPFPDKIWLVREACICAISMIQQNVPPWVFISNLRRMLQEKRDLAEGDEAVEKKLLDIQFHAVHDYPMISGYEIGILRALGKINRSILLNSLDAGVALSVRGISPGNNTLINAVLNALRATYGKSDLGNGKPLSEDKVALFNALLLHQIQYLRAKPQHINMPELNEMFLDGVQNILTPSPMAPEDFRELTDLLADIVYSPFDKKEMTKYPRIIYPGLSNLYMTHFNKDSGMLHAYLEMIRDASLQYPEKDRSSEIVSALQAATGISRNKDVIKKILGGLQEHPDLMVKDDENSSSNAVRSLNLFRRLIQEIGAADYLDILAESPLIDNVNRQVIKRVASLDGVRRSRDTCRVLGFFFIDLAITQPASIERVSLIQNNLSRLPDEPKAIESMTRYLAALGSLDQPLWLGYMASPVAGDSTFDDLLNGLVRYLREKLANRLSLTADESTRLSKNLEDHMAVWTREHFLSYLILMSGYLNDGGLRLLRSLLFEWQPDDAHGIMAHPARFARLRVLLMDRGMTSEAAGLFVARWQQTFNPLPMRFTPQILRSRTSALFAQLSGHLGFSTDEDIVQVLKKVSQNLRRNLREVLLQSSENSADADPRKEKFVQGADALYGLMRDLQKGGNQLPEKQSVEKAQFLIENHLEINDVLNSLWGKRAVNWKEVNSDLRNILIARVAHGYSAKDVVFQATQNAMAMVAMGLYPLRTCQRCIERTNQNADGQLLTRLWGGQFGLANIFQGDTVIGRSLLEITVNANHEPVLLVERFYEALGVPVNTEWMVSGIFEYARFLGIHTVYWAFKPRPDAEPSRYPSLLNLQNYPIYRDTFVQQGAEAFVTDVPTEMTDPVISKQEVPLQKRQRGPEGMLLRESA